MQIYTVLWGCNYNPCWHPDKVIWRFLLGNSCKIRAPDKCISFFLESLSSCSEAKGVHNHGLSQFTFPGSTSLASGHVGYLKPIPQAEAPCKVNRSFPQEDSSWVLACLCRALIVAACHNYFFQLSQSHGVLEC